MLATILTGALLGGIYGIAEHWDATDLKGTSEEVFKCAFSGAIIGLILFCFGKLIAG